MAVEPTSVQAQAPMATPARRIGRDQWLALGLLLAALLLGYLVLVHPWFTAPMLEANERVETLQQRNLLVAMGCRELQGYLLSPPLSRTQIEAGAVAVQRAG